MAYFPADGIRKACCRVHGIEKAFSIGYLYSAVLVPISRDGSQLVV